MKPKTQLGLIILSTLTGILTLLLFTTLVQDVFFKNINYCISGLGDLTVKTFALFSAGAIVGFKASLIVIRSNFWPHMVMTLAVFAQFFFIVGCPMSANPFWFDLLQNALLVFGLWLGSYGALKFPLAPV